MGPAPRKVPIIFRSILHFPVSELSLVDDIGILFSLYFTTQISLFWLVSGTVTHLYKIAHQLSSDLTCWSLFGGEIWWNCWETNIEAIIQ